MVDPNTGIDIYGDSTISTADSVQRVKLATAIMSWPGNKPVAGTWQHFLSFKPNAPLADGDYLVRIKPDGNKLKVEREYTLFHVGSLPRVMWVNFSSSSKTAGQPINHDRVGFGMSEPMDPTKWTLTVESKQSGTFKALSAVNTGGSSVFQLPAPLDTSALFRITLGTDVGATSGLKLDGKYTGQPGSGPFTATFVPKDHVDAGGGLFYVPEIKL